MILTGEAEKTLLEWDVLRYALDSKASDLHLCVGSPAVARVNGRLERINTPVFNNQDLKELLELVADRHLISRFYGEQVDLDYTVELPSLGRRLRLNVFKQHRGISMTLRILSDRALTFEELGLPQSFEKLAHERAGLILVTGGTGSGKSTTLCSLIEAINCKSPSHIITIEDPIEMVFENKSALIEQREIGTHVPDFSTALRSSLREAPDVILVGEIRDNETAMMTLKAAQVGALVMATLHTRSAAETITRFLGMFPDEYRLGARQQLADVLKGILCQTLILSKDGRSRIAACETLTATMAVKHIVREERTHLLNSVMELSSADGMITMEQSLVNLYKTDRLDLQTAYEHCNDKQAFLAQIPAEAQKKLSIAWETEVELRNLEKLNNTRNRRQV